MEQFEVILSTPNVTSKPEQQAKTLWGYADNISQVRNAYPSAVVLRVRDINFSALAIDFDLRATKAPASASPVAGVDAGDTTESQSE